MPHLNSNGTCDTLAPNWQQRPNEPRSWTQRHKIIMVCIGVSFMFANVAYSILAPFFPPTAEEHGVAPSYVGFIFGSYGISQFVFAIIFGKLIPVLGLKTTFIAGYSLTSIATILFGFVDTIDQTSTFIATCFALRIMASVGAAAGVTAGLTILANEFPGSIAQAMGNFTALGGVGVIIGPFIGGILYEVGGFMLPFTSLGGVMFVYMMCITCVLPGDLSQTSTATGSILRILCVPAVYVGTISVLIGSITFSFLEPTLSQELQKFNLNAFQIGSIFLLMGATFIVFSPIFGFLADRFNCSRKLVIFGYCASVLGYMITGPWPIGDITHNITVICFGIVLMNIGVASGHTAGVMDMMTSATFNGFPSGTETYSVLAGIKTSASAFGVFTGPTLGGVLVQQFDFSTATLIYGLFSLLVCFMTMIFSFWEFKCGKARRRAIMFERFADVSNTESEQTVLLINEK